MILIYKFRFTFSLTCFFPQSQSSFVRGYASQRMLDGCPSQIRRHLLKTDVKIKTGLILFRCMYQMFCFIETFLRFQNPFQLFPYLRINFYQITNSRPVDIQRLTDRDILFS